MVNDAQLYGVSVKRLEEFSRKNLKENKNQQEAFIENCVYINHGNYKFLLALFDKKAKIFNLNGYNIVQEFQYKANYDVPRTNKRDKLAETHRTKATTAGAS